MNKQQPSWFVRTSLALVFSFVSITAFAEAPASFARNVAPVLLENCLACHGPKKAEGGYRVDTFAHAMKMGDSQLAPFTPNDLDDSEVVRRIASEDPDERMPLEGDPLPAKQVERIKAWVMSGAKFEGDPAAPLASIIPPPVHPAPPEAYPYTLPITALEFSGDGSEVFASGYHELTVWNTEDGSLSRRILNIDQRTYSIVRHLDGQRLAVGCGSPSRRGEARLLDTATGETLSTLLGTTDVVFDVAFDPSGERLAVAAADSVARVFHLDSDKPELTITSHSDWVMAVAFSADSKRLATASRDKTAKVFDTESGELLVTYNEHDQPVQGVAFHPDGKRVYSSAEDKKVHLWKIDDGKKEADMANFGGAVYQLTTAGDFLFAPSADKSVRQFRLNDRKQVRSYTGHSDWALSVAAHPQTQRLATGSFDGQVRIWSMTDGKLLHTFTAAPGYQAK